MPAFFPPPKAPKAPMLKVQPNPEIDPPPLDLNPAREEAKVNKVRYRLIEKGKNRQTSDSADGERVGTTIIELMAQMAK